MKEGLDKKISIDIAGGEGDYMFRKARENPKESFIILEPTDLSMPHRPPNLHIFKLKTDVDSFLPFNPNSIDEASIHFLMGEIKTKEPNSNTVGEDMGKYERLVLDIKRVLKPGGKIHIVDVKGNIGYIEDILREAEFSITSGPTPLPYNKKHLSKWSEAFFDAYERFGKFEEDSLVLPMMLDAETQP